MSKIKCIVKRPDEEYGHSTYVSDTLENLQQIVDGYIEVVTFHKEAGDILIICNEMGRLNDLEKNLNIFDMEFVGTIIVCGSSGDEFGDIPMDFKTWKRLVDDFREDE